MAYDTTIEGWSRALGYRDKETEGHSIRVTEMTIRLARATWVADEEIIHIRRGALLHDIGKLGVPDNILLKPGKLTDEEMALMKKHPEIAYKLLSPIAFLRPAIDIPYYHHEKWDESGYPRGLQKQEIPMQPAYSPSSTYGTHSARTVCTEKYGLLNRQGNIYVPKLAGPYIRILPTFS